MTHHSFPSCKTQLNSDFKIISKWAFPWKMLLNPDTNKQAIELCFCNKRTKKQPLIFNHTNAQSAANQKYVGLILDSKLN